MHLLLANSSKPRLIALVLIALGSLGALFLGGSEFRESYVRYGGYFHLLVTLALLTGWGALIALREPPKTFPKLRVFLGGVAVIAAGSYALFVHADFGYKIAMDDYLLASMAQNLHESREVATTENLLRDPGSGHLIPASTDVDKRLWLYPFCVSILHDLFGFSVSHSFLFNAICGVVLLAIAYVFGYHFLGAAGGATCVLLWSGLPLIAQNATGGGMELLSLTLLVAVMLSALYYLRHPTALREGTLVLLAVLLAYSRYESALFIAPVAVTVVVGWFRCGRMLLSVPILLAPLLLYAHGLHLLNYLSEPTGWELTQGAQNAFAWSHVIQNLPHALFFFFSWNGELANSPLLTWMGALGLIGLPWIIKHRMMRKERSELKALDICLAIFLPFLFMQFILILGFHASRLDSPFVSRYAMPAYWLLVLTALLLLSHFAQQFASAKRYFVSMSALFIFIYTLPVNADAPFSRKNFVVTEDGWLGSISDQMTEPVIWVDRFLLTHVMRQEAAVGLTTGLHASEELLNSVREGNYGDALYVERLVLSGVDYRPESVQAVAMRKVFEMETVHERSFRPYHLTRVCRLTGLREVSDE